MTHVKCCLPGELNKDSLPKICPRGWSQRHPLPSTYRNSRFPEEHQVFSINHIAYIVLAHFISGTHVSFLGMKGTLLKSKFSDISQRATLQADLSKDSYFWSLIQLSCTAILPHSLKCLVLYSFSPLLLHYRYISGEEPSNTLASLSPDSSKFFLHPDSATYS